MPFKPPDRWRVTPKAIHFDFDVYLNPFLPPNPLRRFPKLIARFLGHRDEPAEELGNVLISIWAFVGAFLGLLVTAAVYKFPSDLQRYHPPVLFASLGATAILDYNTIQSPLAQPRAAIVGHGLSAITGVGIAKLFMLSSDFESLRWVAGPVACGAASFVMSMTNTVHPPGGATAVLAAVDPLTERMGWMFVPFILLGSALMFAIACLVNNLQRQFPVFWQWTPFEVGSWWTRRRKRHVQDVEGLPSPESPQEKGLDDEDERKTSDATDVPQLKHMIILTPERVVLPDGLAVEENTLRMLQALKTQLGEVRSTSRRKGDGYGQANDSLHLTSEASHGSDATHVEHVEWG